MHRLNATYDVGGILAFSKSPLCLHGSKGQVCSWKLDAWKTELEKDRRGRFVLKSDTFLSSKCDCQKNQSYSFIQKWKEEFLQCEISWSNFFCLWQQSNAACFEVTCLEQWCDPFLFCWNSSCPAVLIQIVLGLGGELEWAWISAYSAEPSVLFMCILRKFHS